MVRYYGLGILTPGVGLFHLIFSSNGVMTMSIVGDRGSMPDPAFYRECIEKSFAELLTAAKNAQSQPEAKTSDTKVNGKPAAAKKSSKSSATSTSKSSNSAAKVSVSQRTAKASVGIPVNKPTVRKANSANSKETKAAVAHTDLQDESKVVQIK
jgi:hypothetical protein